MRFLTTLFKFFGHLVKKATKEVLKCCLLENKVVKLFKKKFVKFLEEIMAVAENKKRVVVTLGDEVAKEFDRLADELSLSKSALLTLWINEKRKA